MMSRSVIRILASVSVLACITPAAHASAQAPTSTSTSPVVPPGQTQMRVVRTGETFRPLTDEESIRKFVTDVAVVETEGECTLIRTGGSGATITTAFFPSRKAVVTQISITFDSAGHLVRYSERRGGSRTTGLNRQSSDAQFDSVVRAANASARSTTLSFDYAIDQGVASNTGGGKPTIAILGPVRTLERLESLGNPAARIERVRKLCGV